MDTLSLREKPAVSTSESVIRWKQLWSLAALYASVIVGWIAYRNYQPRLLVQFQFVDFDFLLMAAQGVILAATPMISGRIGDRYRREKGHRLPIIMTGISFAAMVFMAVAFTLLSNPGEVLRWMLPILIVLWLVAMSIFTSPALSTMELFTPVDQLPFAMALLTVTGNVLYSLEPVIVDVIDYLGAPTTFMAGGLAVFLSGYALKRNSMGLFSMSGDRESARSEPELRRSPYAFIFFMGLAVGSATTALFYLFPDLLEARLGAMLNLEGSSIVVGILVVSAVISWPVSVVVNRYGIDRVFRISFFLIVMTTVAIYFTNSPALLTGLLLLFALTYTSLSVSSLPSAIRRSAFSERVFCVGVFFSGVSLPEGVCEAWLAW